MTSQSYRESEANEGLGAAGYLALVLAWAVPGLGHIVIGEKARGIVFAVAIHGLFAMGMLVAGIKAINPPEQQIWTYTQFMTGWPMLAANRVEKQSREELSRLTSNYMIQRPPVEDEARQKQRKDIGTAYIEQHPLFAYHPKVQDIGAVYCGIAGMLNLLVMFDVLLRITGSQREVPGAKPAPGRRVAR